MLSAEVKHALCILLLLFVGVWDLELCSEQKKMHKMENVVRPYV